MTRDVSRFLAPDFLSLTIGIVVYFVGVLTTQRVKFLRNFSIPEPVSGGFIAVAVISLIYFVFNLEIDFDLTTRDRLLVIFFATVGINSRLADLVAGGRTMVVLCVISAVFVFIQNIVGTAGALAFGMPSAAGVVIGSLALSGGHGTTIAWAPLIATEHDFPAAMETGIAVATLGLIIACVLGGPIAKYLIEKYGLQPSSADPVPIELAPEDDKAPIDKMGVMRAMLVVNIAVILGYLVHHWISNATTIKVPLFVPCLIMGMVLSNTCSETLSPLALASTNSVARSYFKLFAVNLPRHVAHEHAALDFGQDCRAAACYRGRTDAAGSDIYLARGLSCTWEGLSGCGAERWVHRHIAWLNADGHRNHDGGH